MPGQYLNLIILDVAFTRRLMRCASVASGTLEESDLPAQIQVVNLVVRRS